MADSAKLEILKPDGQSSVFDITPGVYPVGSDEECLIRISHPDIESRHAIFIFRDHAFWIEDLAGVRLEGIPVRGRTEVIAGQKIQIGPFTLRVVKEAPAAKEPPPPAEVKPNDPLPPNAAPPSPKLVYHTAPAAPAPPSSFNTEFDLKRSVKQQIHRELMERLDIKRMTAARISKVELHEKALKTLQAIVADVSGKLPAGINPEALIKDIYDEALGLGPLEEFLADPSVTEVMVNGPAQVYYEKGGKLFLSDKTFMDEASVLAIIERIVSPIGRRIDESQPYVDARLPDGSRVNAIIHPLSLVGPCLTIRKFSKTPFTDKDLVRFGTVTPSMMEFADICVKMRKNIIVSGGTGSGKTSLLNVLSSYLPDTDRIVTIEDAAELKLRQKHVVRLEARPPNIEGKGAVTIRDLVRNSLRMRPDRIVVGECRGGEALDMLQAMNTGHDGSLTTVHANSPRDVISRLETMVLMSGMELPVRAIREQLASAIDVIVHEARCSDGSRKVTKITEVVGLEGEQITMQDIFEFRQTGIGEGGKVLGHFRPTGAVPTFIEEVTARGMTINRAMFDPQQWKE